METKKIGKKGQLEQQKEEQRTEKDAEWTAVPNKRKGKGQNEKRSKKRKTTQKIIKSEIKLTADITPKKKREYPNERNEERVPEVIQNNPDVQKYWPQRYLLFSKYDEGIQLDKESWYSVTPEEIAKHHASRVRPRALRGLVVIDAFCGAGGNAIQFALNGYNVKAIDIDQSKLDLAEHNANIYGVPADKITFICGDFMKLADGLEGDVVFLSPPWGGPDYQKRAKNGKKAATYNIHTMMPINALEMMEKSKKITDKIFLYVPKTTDVEQLAALAGEDGRVEVEENILNGGKKALTAYYGGLITAN